jgi:uridine kinase
MIDYDLLIQCLETISKKLKPFNKPIYDPIMKVRKEETTEIEPQQCIIVTGDLIFCNEKLRKFFDLSIFVDTDDDVRLSRRVLKNELKKENKIPLAELLRTYEEKTKPAFEKYIEPTKKFANMIIPNYGFSTVTLEVDQMQIHNIGPIVNHIEKQVNIRK